MNSEHVPLARSQVLRDLCLLFLVLIACSIPFLSQPFHMDDNFYMDMARNALRNPLYPNDTPYVFDGFSVPDMGSHSHPPLQTYFLAAILRLAGEGPGKEWIYHAFDLVYALLAVGSMYFLSARLVARPLWPSLALACCPLFMVMQHNLMTDLPTLSFWLASIAAFVWATNGGSGGLYLASSAFQFAAMFTSYHSVVLAPLLGFYHVRKKGRRMGWVALAAPVAVMTLWFVLSSLHYRRFLLSGTADYLRLREWNALGVLGSKFVALLEYQGWLIIFPASLLYVFARGLRGRLLALMFAGSLYGAWGIAPSYRAVDKAILVVGLTTGAFVLGRMAWLIASTRRRFQPPPEFDRTETELLSLWYFGTIGLCLIAFTEGSARYIMPLIPPVLLVFFRQLELMETGEYRSLSRSRLSAGVVANGSLALSLACGLILSHADMEAARVYPPLARRFAGAAGGMPAYYAGEWGFRYYMSQAGIRQLPRDDSEVRGGSFVALPKLAIPYDPPAALKGMMAPVETITCDVKTPVRLLDSSVPAGFYSTGWGWLPFSFSRSHLEVLEVLQVNYLVAELPAAAIEATTRARPLPGYLAIEGRNPLALLMHAGCSVKYPWTAPVPTELSLTCAVSPAAYSDGGAESFEFEVCQRSAQGEVIASGHVEVTPGLKQQDRGWQHLVVPLRGRRQGGDNLELRFTSNGEHDRAVGAFAEPLLRPR
jgi:hypothetical protein